MTAEQSFLDYSARKLTQLGGRIADCLDRLTEEQIWARGGTNENAVGNLVLHLCGNAGQWIGHGVGGHPDTRQRDAEFAARGDAGTAELKHLLDEVLKSATSVIANLPPGRLVESITIQGYRVTVLEAIYHVVEHFSGHTGQIQYATKLLTGADLGYYRHLPASAHGEQVP